jgi:predicted kinase
MIRDADTFFTKKHGKMILFVIGLPASGKSYFAKHTADEIGAVHLNTDVIRKEINKQGQYDEQSKQLVYAYLKKEMIRHAQNGEHVVVDGTFQKKENRNQFAQEAHRHAREVYFIEMRATEKTVRQRLQTERRNSEADYKVYQQIKHTFEPMKEPHLILWTDENNVAELIQKLKIYINEQRTNS